MILIVCSQENLATQGVKEELESRHEKYVIVHAQTMPDETHCTISFSGSAQGFLIKTETDTISSKEINSVWYWHPERPQLTVPKMRRLVRDFCEEEWSWFVQGIWRVLSDCYWLNDPRWIREAEHKPYQLKIAREIGFSIPDTIISNDPAEIGRLYTRHDGRVIHKTVHTQFTRLSKDRLLNYYTRQLKRTDLRDPRALSLQPAIYQENVEKRYDIRVTVVGRRVFAAEIHSQLSRKSRQDFRQYDLEKTPYKVHELPAEIQGKCRTLLKVLRLDYGAIDMILTPEGRYIFLEINPSGHYEWIEGLTGMQISSAICDALTRQTSQGS